MSDEIPGAPATPPTPDPAAPPAAPAEQPLHPVWDQAMAAIPDSLRGPLVNQIRTTEREHQAAIEQARQNAASPEWAGLIQEAGQLGVTPADLATAYGYSESIRQNPLKFINDMTQAIEARGDLPATDPNHLSKSEMRWLKQELAAGTQQLQDGTPNPLAPDADDPGAKALAEIQKLRDEQTARELAQQQAQQEAQAQQTAEQFAQTFISTLAAKTEGASDAQRNIIGSWANALIQGDRTGRLTADQALDAAVKAGQEAGMVWQAPVAGQPAAPAQPIAPVGGGSAAVPPAPGAAPIKHAALDTPAGRNQQRDAMLAAAAQMGPVDDTDSFGIG